MIGTEFFRLVVQLNVSGMTNFVVNEEWPFKTGSPSRQVQFTWIPTKEGNFLLVFLVRTAFKPFSNGVIPDRFHFIQNCELAFSVTPK